MPLAANRRSTAWAVFCMAVSISGRPSNPLRDAKVCANAPSDTGPALSRKTSRTRRWHSPWPKR